MTNSAVVIFTSEDTSRLAIEQLNDATITFNTPFSGAPSDVVLTINAMDYNIGDLMDLDNNNPINLSQFIDFEDELQTIDPENASQFLDTNIFELIDDYNFNNYNKLSISEFIQSGFCCQNRTLFNNIYTHRSNPIILKPHK